MTRIAARLVTCALLAAVPAAAGPGQASDPRALELARRIDDLYRSRTSYAQVEMEILTPDWQRTLVLRAWTEGQDKMLIRILEPKKEAGVGTLRIGPEMWNYLPKTDKVIKIPPSMMMSSWMGSDFTNDDLVKEFTFLEDFTFALIRPGDGEAGLLYLECRPKPGVPIIWDKIVTAVRETDSLPVWQKYYDEKGRVARIMNYGQVRTFGRRTVPSVLEMIPQTKQGYKTVLRYQDVQFDLALDAGLFSLRSLQSGR
jgi:outer membrane lipoprotein-sorting protein